MDSFGIDVQLEGNIVVLELLRKRKRILNVYGLVGKGVPEKRGRCIGLDVLFKLKSSKLLRRWLFRAAKIVERAFVREDKHSIAKYHAGGFVDAEGSIAHFCEHLGNIPKCSG